MRPILYVYDTFHPYTRGGGPNVSCRLIVEALAQLGLPVSVLTSRGRRGFLLSDAEIADGEQHFGALGVDIRYTGTDGRLDPRLAWAVLKESGGTILHLNGTFSSTIVSGIVRSLVMRDARLVISPRGMMTGAAVRSRRARGKRLALAVIQAGARRAIWHTTSADEQETLVGRGLPAERVFTIPNPVPYDPDRQIADERYGFLCFGRIARVKGLDLILDAYQQAWRANPDLEDLTFAGAEDGLRFEAVAEQFPGDLMKKVRWVGELTGPAKHELLSTSRAVVNASVSESFGMSIAESLEHGTPVITCEGSPWAVVNEVGAGSHGPRTLPRLAAEFLEFNDRTPADLAAMGSAGRQLVARTYRPEVVAGAYAEMYAAAATL